MPWQPSSSIWLDDQAAASPRRVSAYQIGQRVLNLKEVVELYPVNPSHQARLAARTPLVVKEVVAQSATESFYHCQLLDERGHRTPYWALVRDSQLTATPPTRLERWLARLSSWFG